VTLRVLVTADGRAGKVKIVKGLGFGLDERAMDKVRMWRFEPARDANRRAIAEWIIVEATYRLFEMTRARIVLAALARAGYAGWDRRAKRQQGGQLD